MKKLVMALVALAAIVAVATPALAEIKVNGYYRLQGIMTNSDDSSILFDGPDTLEPNTQSIIDQRLRMKVTNTLNENVKIVWYGEVDGTFGVGGKDGGPGGDRTSVETKNAYLDFKIPNSMFSVKTGLQGVGGRYQGLILADDWSAIKIGMDLNDTTKLTFLYSKPSEGFYNDWDDVDFYNVSFDTKAGDVKIGADLMWFDDNSAGAATAAGAGDSPLFGMSTVPYDLYLAAIKADAKIGDVSVDGFFIYATGGQDDPAGIQNSDISAYAASVHVSAKVNDIGLGGRIIYMSGDDGTDADLDSFIPNLGGNYNFAKENLMIFMTDAYYNNGPGGRLAIDAATLNGSGLIGLTAQANATFGDFYLKSGIGYFMASETPVGVEDDMGFEVAARVGTKVAGNVDCSIAGAYAVLGEYWNIGTSTPDDIFKVSAMVNVGF
jgi:hypothetical protein